MATYMPSTSTITSTRISTSTSTSTSTSAHQHTSSTLLCVFHQDLVLHSVACSRGQLQNPMTMTLCFNRVHALRVNLMLLYDGITCSPSARTFGARYMEQHVAGQRLRHVDHGLSDRRMATRDSSSARGREGTGGIGVV